MKERAYKGLTSGEVLRSKELHGSNEYAKRKKKSVFRLFIESFSDPIIRILLVAFGINVLFTIKNVNWAETVGIVIAILISTIVSTISEYTGERAFEKLRSTQENTTVNVIRNEKTEVIQASELVVGDLVLLREGDRIAADGMIAEGYVRVDQSTINGEPEPAEKRQSVRLSDESCKLYAGSLIVEGEGLMTVTAVGEKSVYGRIAGEIQTESMESPLKARLGKLAKTISKIGYAAAALVSLTFLFKSFVIDAQFDLTEILLRLTNLRFVALKLIKAVTIAMTVIVVAVPEGLPMMITVVLSSNMKKMMKDNVLVRKLVGIETAGCVNILFTDKTGTLTCGKPVCREFVFGNGEVYTGREELDDRIIKLLQRSVFLNTGCTMSGKKPVGGNPTERALCAFLTPPDTSERASNKLPFNSKNKYSMAQSDGSDRLVYVKGAAETILPFCRCCYGINGSKQQFDEETVRKAIVKRSKESARIIVFATQDRFIEPSKAGPLTFLCFAVLEDGLRSTAKSAVNDLKNAGIHTVMITGDSRETAERIALECGIKDERRTLVLTGKDLENMTDEALERDLDRLAVVARALPSDKSRLVRISRKKGLVVGMTGDGVNDAPALKLADVGFSMGDGTEIAKEASDIVILDNDLSSVVNAVLYGRTVFKSIRKFITFQLIMNLFAVGISLIGQLVGVDSPITVIQMLWVNVIMDTLGGLAFSGEHPQKYYLMERPINKEEPILKKSSYVQIAVMGCYAIVTGTAFLCSRTVRAYFNYDQNKLPLLSAFFALFIFTGIAICFTTRSERMNIAAGLEKNKPFIVIMSLITIIQLLMLYFGGETFRCVGLSARALALVTVIALSVVPADLLRRIVQKKTSKHKK